MNKDSLVSSLVLNQVTDLVHKNVGLSEDTSKTIVDKAIGILLTGLAKNSSTVAGAENLSKALSKDHDGSILTNLPTTIANQDLQKDGQKIVDHIFGSKTNTISTAIGSQTEVKPEQVLQVLTMVAPVLMGALGKKQKEDKLDPSNIATMLLQSAKKSSGKETNILVQLLDRNNDGSVVDDLMRLGVQQLQKLTKK